MILGLNFYIILVCSTVFKIINGPKGLRYGIWSGPIMTAESDQDAYNITVTLFFNSFSITFAREL